MKGGRLLSRHKAHPGKITARLAIGRELDGNYVFGDGRWRRMRKRSTGGLYGRVCLESATRCV
jgi:hypothetical protein